MHGENPPRFVISYVCLLHTCVMRAYVQDALARFKVEPAALFEGAGTLLLLKLKFLSWCSVFFPSVHLWYWP